jgi:hypothetical protein
MITTTIWGGVDLANQYRAGYETHKSAWRSWFCIFTAMLDIIVVNCYRISYVVAEQRGIPKGQRPTHAAFRKRLFNSLSLFLQPFRLVMWSVRNFAIFDTTRLSLHEWVTHGKKTGCIQCRIDVAEEKKLLKESKEVTFTAKKDSNGRATLTMRGCKQCNVALCVTRGCWERYHSQ